MSLKPLAFLGVVIAVLSGYVYQNNPLIFGGPSTSGKSQAISDHVVYDHYPHLDDELFSLASAVGHDFGAYRNHCLRVLTFTKYFLPASFEKDFPGAIDLAATSIPYMRTGLWKETKTNPLNHVESSKDHIDAALKASFTPPEMDILRAIVLQQHKITDYAGMDSEKGNILVNAVRKANWVDITMGLVRFGLPASLLEAAYEELNSAGFHRIVWERYTKPPSSIITGVLNVVKW